MGGCEWEVRGVGLTRNHRLYEDKQVTHKHTTRTTAHDTRHDTHTHTHTQRERDELRTSNGATTKRRVWMGGCEWDVHGVNPRCKTKNRSHTQHDKNNTTQHTTRTTPQQHNTRHDKNNMNGRVWMGCPPVWTRGVNGREVVREEVERRLWMERCEWEVCKGMPTCWVCGAKKEIRYSIQI